jgi:hypothetical protein
MIRRLDGIGRCASGMLLRYLINFDLKQKGPEAAQSRVNPCGYHTAQRPLDSDRSVLARRARLERCR